MTAHSRNNAPAAERLCFQLAKRWALVALILSLATAAQAGPLVLAWDPSPDPTVIGYVVLYGTAPATYTGTLDVGSQLSATLRGLADGQTYYFAVQAYSAAGRLSTFSNVVSGTATNKPPLIATPAPQSGAEGGVVTLALAGSDPDADPLTYTAAGLPPGLSLDAATGVISGTLAFDAAGNHAVTVTVSDGPASSSATFPWVVAETEQAPVVTVPDLSHGVGAQISYAIPATEPDGTLMTFSATGLPAGLELNAHSGTITGTLTAAAGIYLVTLVVTDEELLSTTARFQWTVLASNAPPALEPPGDQEGNVVNPASLQLAASDPDGNTLTYSATGLPSGLILDNQSGTIVGQPTSGGVFAVTASVSDGLASPTRTFTWTILANRAPTIESIPNTSSLVFGSVSFDVQATDPDNSGLTFGAVGLPSGLVIDADTGSITGAPTQVGVNMVTIVVSDGTLSASRTFSWTILANRAPTLQNPGAQSSEEYRSLLPFTASSSDPDGNPLTFAAVGLPPGLWIDTESGAVAGLPTLVGSYTVTLTVSDGAASASQTFQWVIFPNPPPTIENPGAQSGAVVGTPVFLPITAGDPNGHDFTLTASGLPPGLALDQTLMMILGTPTTAGAYPDARLTAFDGARFTSVSFTWTVAASPGPFTFVQANQSAPGGVPPSSVTVPYAAPQRVGSLNVVAIGWHDSTATIASVTDTIGNAYVLAVGPTVVSDIATQSVYYAANIGAAAAGENVVQVTFTIPAAAPDVRIAEYAGVRAVAPVTGTAAAQGNSALSDSGVLTTTTPTLLLVAANFVSASATPAAGESFASRVMSSQGSLLEDRTVTTPGSYHATAPITPDGAWIMQMAAFRPVNTAPSLGPVSAQTHLENDEVAVWLGAIDPDGDPLTYDALNLPDGLGINNDTGLIAGQLTFGSAGVRTVTATVSDGEVTISREFGWTVINVNRAPVVFTIPSQTNAEQTSVSLLVTATDPDGDTLSFSAAGLPEGIAIHPATGAISGTLSYTSASVRTVTVTASDGTLSASRTFTWTVTNLNREPLLTAVVHRTDAENATISLQVVAADPDGDAVTFSAIGLPTGLTINASTGLIDGTLSYASAGTHVVTILASDGELVCRNTFTWTVTNVDRGPVMTALSGRTDAENTAVSLQVVAADPDGDVVTYSATGLPAGLGINGSTGLISGTLSYASAGSPTVTATASDGTLTSSRTFTWTVTNVNRAPVVTAIPDQTRAENTAISLAVTGLDPDGDTLTFSATGLPDGLTISAATGTITGTLSYVSAGTHVVVVAASDGTLSDSRTFAWTVTNVNRPPTLTDVPDRTDPENVLIAILLAGADPDAGATLTYSAAPLPAGITLNAASGLISGTLTYASAGSSTVILSVSDGTVSANQTFAWTVTNVNRPPTLTGVPDRTDPENVLIAILLAGADLDTGTTLTYSAAPLPAGIAVNPATGLISGTLTYASAGNYTVAVSVSDGTVSANQTFAWTVTNVNRPPTLTDVPDRTDPENVLIAILLAGADLDTGTTLTYSAAPLPAGIAVNPATGLISGTLTYASAGSFTVTISVSDGTVSANQTFTWTVTNVNRAPALTAISNQSSAENATVTLPVVTVDPDGDTLAFSATGLPGGLTISPTTGAITGTLSYTSGGVHTVTVTTSDGTLAGSQLFTWTVTNVNRAPTLTALGHLSTTTEMSVLLQLAASDPDGDLVSYGAAGLPPGLSVDPNTGLISGTPSSPGGYTVTAIAADASLSHSQSFAWTVAAKPVGRVKFIQANSSTGQAPESAVTVRLAAAQAIGHLNVVVVGWRDAMAAVQAVTDTTGNLYQLAAGPTEAAGVGTQAIYYSVNTAAAAAGGNAVVVAFTAPPTLPDIRVASYTGIDPVNPVEAASAAQGSGGTLDSGTLSTTFADDLLFGAGLVAESATTAPGAGYTTRLLSRPGNLLEDRVVTTTGSYSATANLSPSSGWIMQMVAFRDPNHAPTLTSPENQISTEHESIWVALAGRDQDDEPLTYSVTGLPVPLTVNPSTGVIAGTLSYASAGTYTITATVSDGHLQSTQRFTWTVTDRAPASRATAGDFTGDGRADPTMYRPTTGVWSILKSGMSSTTWSYQWGISGDLPVPGDYDGDGRTDIAIYRPSDGHWYILKSSTNYTAWFIRQWGVPGDVPVPGDYDGDGKIDLAIYRPSDGNWYVMKSSTNYSTWIILQWGTSGDFPVPGDYDGDGKLDIAIYRPSNGYWFILTSSSNFASPIVRQWGISGDKPVPGDYDGDAKTDLAVYRPSDGMWYVLKSGTNYTTWIILQWGISKDKPVPGDYDGDGRTDVAIYRPSTGTWFILKSGTNFTTWDILQWGIPGDSPVFQGR